MIRHMSGEMKPGTKDVDGRSGARADLLQRESIAGKIEGFHAVSRVGLWRVLLFLVISIAALPFRDFDLFSLVPENVAEILGAPPPTDLIHIVLGVSVVCAVILIPGRAAAQPELGHNWLQFWLMAAFYPLYAVNGVLGIYFPVVLAAGLLVLAVEHFIIWNRVCCAIREEKERVG
jgi:hypothetical protein